MLTSVAGHIYKVIFNILQFKFGRLTNLSYLWGVESVMMNNMNVINVDNRKCNNVGYGFFDR
jgi:hypothetical protein